MKTWTKREINVLEPIERLDMPSWMEKHRVMPKGSVKPGLWDMELTPYLKGLMELITRPETEEFVFKKPAQIAGSELAHSFLMYASDQQPGDSLVVLADQDTAEHVCKDRFEKSYKASAKLSKLYRGSTMHTIKTEGSTIYFAWATSINKLASKPIKYLVLDENSKYKTNNLETKPTYNAIERTETHVDSKVIMPSTPNVPGSEIDIFFRTAHQRFHYYVPCPHCGFYQVLRWTQCEYFDLNGEKRLSGQVYWQGGTNASPQQVNAAGYACGECGTIWTTAEKNNAVSKGIWHTNDKYEGTPTKLAAHINRIYSLFPGGRFHSLVEEFIRKKKDGTIDAWKGFINNTLAEEFEEVVEKPQKMNIFSKVSSNKASIVPSDTIALTCGVDNQKDFKYYVILAFNKDFKASLVEYGRKDDFNAIEALGEELFQLDNGNRYCKVWRGAVDSGGTSIDGKNMTHEVYSFVRNSKKFFAIKGRDMDNAVIVQKKKLEDNNILYRVNTQALIDQLYWMLGKEEFTFHAETDKEFMNHLLNMQKIRDNSGNFVWKQKGGRVDYVHCICYALAAAHPQWDNGITELKRLPFLQNINVTKVKKAPQKRLNRTVNPNFGRV